MTSQYRRSNWRGVQEWKKYGLEFSTTCDEACKLFDGVLTQYVGLYNDMLLGGVGETLSKLMDADPHCVMGHVLALGLEVIGSGRLTKAEDPSYREKLDQLEKLATGSNVTAWEKLHVTAVSHLAHGQVFSACQVWEDILVDYPQDMLALRFAYDMYLYLGLMPQRRDSVARVLPHWSPDMPLYGYIHGLYCFGLCETNEFARAEVHGKKALELNPEDTWATHSLVHVYEMTGRTGDGLTLLRDTVRNWEPQQELACHNYWHWALYNIEQGEFEEALGIFDGEVYRRAMVGRSGFNVSDCSSLLRRLEIEGVKVGDRWSDVYEICRDDVEGGDIMPFSEAHYLMCCIGAKHTDVARKITSDILEFIKSGDRECNAVKREVCTVLYESLVAFDDGDYALAVNLLHPVRYQIYRIGGSNAQRDVFNLILIDAALKSADPQHHRLARSLLAERKASIENSQLGGRLLQRALALH